MCAGRLLGWRLVGHDVAFVDLYFEGFDRGVALDFSYGHGYILALLTADEQQGGES